MKNILLLSIATCGLLTLTSTGQASPKSMERRHAQITTMCQEKPMRIMMIRELMRTKEGKTEMAKMLKEDSEFRSVYETMALNPG